MAYTTIKKPSNYFDIILRQGFGSSGGDVTGLSFKPDMIWEKNRTSTIGTGTYVYDIVKGVYKFIRTNLTDAEATNTNVLTSFNSDGYTVGNADYGTDQSLVSWNWLASNTTASNTDGSITSTVSANTTSGFSIVSYTGNGTAGATIGHGLGVEPSMIIFKKRNAINSWITYHKSLGTGNYVYLNLTNALTSDTAWCTPSSSTFELNKVSNATNLSGDTYIAYCFAEKQGYSKFGSYTGNGNADGSFIYTGFKPAFVIVKRTDAIQGWYILDNKRNTFNPEDKYLETNDADAEATFTFCDFLSNGFKARTTGTGFNASGGSYIYMAFAEQPLVGDNPATAR
jgi:hypothetical protein